MLDQLLHQQAPSTLLLPRPQKVPINTWTETRATMRLLPREKTWPKRQGDMAQEKVAVRKQMLTWRSRHTSLVHPTRRAAASKLNIQPHLQASRALVLLPDTTSCTRLTSSIIHPDALAIRYYNTNSHYILPSLPTELLLPMLNMTLLLGQIHSMA